MGCANWTHYVIFKDKDMKLRVHVKENLGVAMTKLHCIHVGKISKKKKERKTNI